MALIDDLEFCHCDLNSNLSALVSAAQGATDMTVLGCGEVRAERAEQAERYANALEAWLSGSTPSQDVASEFQTASVLLGDHGGRKDELAGHLVKRLRDNGYEFYAPEDEDFSTPDSRIQHLEICCFNWEHNLLILLDEIGQGKRSYDWHGVGLFCACGDKDPDNNYPEMLRARLDSIQANDQTLLGQLRAKLEEAYA